MSKPGVTRLQYIGVHDAVDVARDDGSIVTAIRGGDPITVSTPLADAMLEQTVNWRPYTPTTTAAPAPVTAPDSAKEE